MPFVALPSQDLYGEEQGRVKASKKCLANPIAQVIGAEWVESGSGVG